MTKKRFFGTDGIRGKVGQSPITADFVLRLGWAAGKVLADRGPRSVLIGKDTRISGYMFESALEAGLSAAGANSKLLGPMPTPAVAYLTRTLHCNAGIVISASHNPYDDNGIKFFSPQGEKLADDVELAIEAALEEPFDTVDPAALGKAERVPDARGRYIEFCKRAVPSSLNLRGIHMVVDCAQGATYQVAPPVFEELGARVTAIAAAPDGLNINTDCGSTAPAALQRAVLEQDADLGVAFDGDGDRVIMVDHHGEVVDGDELLYIIARDAHNKGCLRGDVVGTVMSNLGLERALATLGVGFQRAKVGDRYVHEMLVRNGWRLGGETSGHIICLEHSTTGDGIISALQVLNAMAETGLSLRELRAGMDKFPQVMINVPVDDASALEDSEGARQAVAHCERELGDEGRVILRPSGTEPVVRVTIEGPAYEDVERLSRYLADVVQTELTRT